MWLVIKIVLKWYQINRRKTEREMLVENWKFLIDFTNLRSRKGKHFLWVRKKMFMFLFFYVSYVSKNICVCQLLPRINRIALYHCILCSSKLFSLKIWIFLWYLRKHYMYTYHIIIIIFLEYKFIIYINVISFNFPLNFYFYTSDIKNC